MKDIFAWTELAFFTPPASPALPAPPAPPAPWKYRDRPADGAGVGPISAKLFFAPEGLWKVYEKDEETEELIKIFVASIKTAEKKKK